jgi:hypothetical protein
LSGDLVETPWVDCQWKRAAALEDEGQRALEVRLGMSVCSLSLVELGEAPERAATKDRFQS